MDILNEVEVLFKKLDAVPGDLKEEAVRKIVEKLYSSDSKSNKEVLVSKKRSIKRRKRTSSKDQNTALGPEYQSSDFKVENVLTSRGRKAKRICCNQLKQINSTESLEKDSKVALHSHENQAKSSGNYEYSKYHNRGYDLFLTYKVVADGNNSGTSKDMCVKSEPSGILERGSESLSSVGKIDVDVNNDEKNDGLLEEPHLVIVDHEGQCSDETESLRSVQICTTEKEKKKVAEKDKSVTRSSETKREREIDSSPVILTCDECSFQTENKARLRNHIKKHVGLRPHKCQECGKAFPQMSALKIHLKRHRGQRDFPCDYVCNYRAYTHGDKVRHMTLHTGERNHQCQYCGKAFAKDSTLREHVKTVHERPNKHICATCGFATYRANNLRVHISMRHRGEYNNHVCPVCGAKVKQRAAFLDHMRSHTGERPYKCQLCSSSFTCLARLTVHRKAVHGPREFTCEHCQKSFQTKHHMLRHQLTHTNEKPYACPFCQYSCNTQGNVTKHVKGVHNKPDFSYRKYKAEQQVDFDYAAVKDEWIEKGEKLTEEYLRDLSKKLGRDVTLSELKEREAEKNKHVGEEVEQVKKRRSRKQEQDTRKQEHDYHSKIAPEEENRVANTEEPTAVLLTVTQTQSTTPTNDSLESGILSQTPVIHGVTMNSSPCSQPTLFIQTPQDNEISRLQPVLPEPVHNSNNQETPIQNIQFCVDERGQLEEQLPLQVIYHSPSSRHTSQETSEFHSSKYMDNIKYVEVKGDATAMPPQTVVVIIKTENQ